MSSAWATEVVATRAAFAGEALIQAWAEFLGRIPWQLFVTLTFDPKRVWDIDRQLALRETRWWCGEVARLTRRPVAWVIGPERGHGGRWHTHVLLVGLPELGLGPAPIPMWRQRNGYIDVQPVAEATGVALYTSKQAALAGEVELSDTIARYRYALSETVRVDLIRPELDLVTSSVGFAAR